ncbi:MAG: transketolase [Helicobacter sp.]|nr:transketolase [Helicobacter sp.]
MRNAIAECIKQKAKEDSNFFLITGDAGLGVWDDYKDQYSLQYINPGINEALCVGMAAGMALCGKKVVYYNIAPFVIMRPFEHIRNDICYQELGVILIATGSGLTYMPSGMTHYALEDIGIALALPNLNIFSPCDSLEAKACFEYAYFSKNPSYIRIPKAGEPILHKEDIEDISKVQLLRQYKSEVLLLGHSAIMEEVLKASEFLRIDAASMPFINAKHEENLELLRKYKKIFVIEEHFSYGGLGTYLNHILDKKVEILGVPNHYIHIIGNQEFGRKVLGLDKEGIINFVKEKYNG